MRKKIPQVVVFYTIGFLCIFMYALFFRNVHEASAAGVCPSPSGGWGSPQNVFSSGQEPLISETTTNGTSTIKAGSGSTSQYIYKTGYYCNKGKWTPFTFTGTNSAGGNTWYIGNAQAILQGAEQPLSFIAYVCTRVTNTWKCGCKDKESCKAKGQWQYVGVGGFASGPANSTDCLTRTGAKVVLNGNQAKEFTGWQPNLIIDARSAKWPNTDTTNTGWPALAEGANNDNICWIGGEMINGNPLSTPADAAKYGTYNGMTVAHADNGFVGANGAGTNWDSTNHPHGGGAPTNYLYEGVFMYGGANSLSSNSYDLDNVYNWTLKDSWVEYGRDDCIENDGHWSATIDNNLFDGCYGFLSMRYAPAGPLDTVQANAKHKVVLQNNLVRLEPQPGPFLEGGKKVFTTVNGKKYGHGSFFKGAAFWCYSDACSQSQMEAIGSTAWTDPVLIMKNNIFLAEQEPEEGWDYAFQVKLDKSQCANNTLIWLGAGNPANGNAHFPSQWPASCLKVVTGQAGRDLWKQAVTDWHSRHPDVGKDYKPKHSGTWTWPRTPQTEAAEFGLSGLKQ